MDSARNIESTIEAAKALLSEEKMTVVKERAEEFHTESKQIISTAKVRKALISSEQGLKPKNVGTLKSDAGAIRQKALCFLFLITFGIWAVLLVICLPISGLINPVFPLIISNTMMMSFLMSAAIASILSLIIGISKLRGKG